MTSHHARLRNVADGHVDDHVAEYHQQGCRNIGLHERDQNCRNGHEYIPNDWNEVEKNGRYRQANGVLDPEYSQPNPNTDSRGEARDAFDEHVSVYGIEELLQLRLARIRQLECRLQ